TNVEVSRRAGRQRAPDAAPPELPADAVAVLRGSTFMLSDPSGDVRAGSFAGLFHRDTRLVSEFRLAVEGQRLRPISSGQTDFHAARFFLTNPPLDGIPAGWISVQRHLVVWEDLHEGVVDMCHVYVLVMRS